MPYSFTYTTPVSGLNFLPRKKEIIKITELLTENNNALLFDSINTGKRSIINQAFLSVKKKNPNKTICNINLFNIRNSSSFINLFLDKIIETLTDNNFNKDTFFEKYIDNYQGLELLKAVLELPEKLSIKNKIEYIIYFEEFQNLLFLNDFEDIITSMENIWSNHKNTSYIITGSRINDMKYIFMQKKYLYGFATYIPLETIECNDFSNYIIKTFLRAGRVVEKQDAIKIYNFTQGHPYYCQLLSDICFNNTKGYLNNNIINDSIEKLIVLMKPHFIDWINDLTNFQINLLEATNDGVINFSYSKNIKKYDLRSSANIVRLKEALIKKEIITFDENNKPVIINPIFKYWLKNYYFINK
ncbi:MAG: hypothetical protein WC140_00635 [Bacteroidales bacterium]